MYDGYYDREIDRCKRELKIYALGMDVCIKLLKIKNDRAREKLQDRAYKIRSADLDKAGKLKAKFNNEINKITPQRILLYTDVEEVIEKEKSRYIKDLEYNEINDMTESIVNNVITSLKFYTNQYVETKRRIEQLKKDKIEDAKREAEKARKLDQQRYPSNETDYTYSTPSYSSYSTYDEPVHREPRPFSGIDEEESKKLLDEMIDKEIANKYDFYGFSYEEEKRIKELYPELDHYHDYYSVDTLNTGVKIENIANKKDIKVDNIMEMGLLTLEVVTKELLQGTHKVEPRVFSKLHMKNNFEKYQKAYDKFMTYYRSLSPVEKSKIDNQISDNDRYTDIFGPKIANPDLLKRTINQTVTNYIIKNYNQFYGFSEKNFLSKTLHAARYMSVEEIVVLYNGIKKEEEQAGIYIRDEEERKRIEKSKQEYLQLLQEDFARVILTKLEKHNKKESIVNMNDEQLKRFFDKEHKKIAGIITDIMHENPMSKDLRQIAEVQEGKGTNIKGTFEAKEEAKAKSKVYDENIFKKAYLQMTGQWNKYLMLMEKEELTEKEQEELKGIFK